MVMFTEDPPVGGTDGEIQLLEAAKAGDLEVVKVRTSSPTECTVTEDSGVFRSR